MANAGGDNGDYSSRFDRLEKIVADLLKHARLVDRQLDSHERQLEVLRGAQVETNAAVKSLVGAIRDLIDRIPPENLR